LERVRAKVFFPLPLRVPPPPPCRLLGGFFSVPTHLLVHPHGKRLSYTSRPIVISYNSLPCIIYIIYDSGRPENYRVRGCAHTHTPYPLTPHNPHTDTRNRPVTYVIGGGVVQPCVMYIFSLFFLSLLHTRPQPHD